MFSKSRFNTRMMDSKCFLWVCLRTSCFFVISRRHWVMKPIGGACRCWWTSSCSFPPLSCVVWMRWVHSKSMRRPLLLGVRFLDHIMPYHAARNVFVSRCIKWISEESRFFFLCVLSSHHRSLNYAIIPISPNQTCQTCPSSSKVTETPVQMMDVLGTAAGCS